MQEGGHVGYSYRRTTAKERAEVVAYRRKIGHPFHGPPHPYRGSGWFCITAANYEHKQVMSEPERLSAFEDRLLMDMDSAGVEIGAWLILTNHYYVLLGVDSLDQVSSVLQRLHGATSREWNLEDGLTGERKIWNRFSDRHIRNERHYYHAMGYLHYNPVKHGYVDSPYEWPWSSVHVYYQTHGKRWLREKWIKHPAAKGWDYGDRDGSDEAV